MYFLRSEKKRVTFFGFGYAQKGLILALSISGKWQCDILSIFLSISKAKISAGKVVNCPLLGNFERKNFGLFWKSLMFLKSIIFIEKFDKISKKVLKKLYKRLVTQLPTIFDCFGANRVQSQSAFFRNGGSIILLFRSF